MLARAEVRHWSLLRLGLVVPAAALLAMSCSSGEGTTPDAQGSSSPVLSADGGEVGDPNRNPLAECPHRDPGELMTPDEATVRFSPSRICPAYVTVGPGDTITFVNLSNEVGTVRIWSGLSAPDTDVPQVTNEIAGGEQWTFVGEAPGVLTYRIDTIPTFTGTIELVG